VCLGGWGGGGGGFVADLPVNFTTITTPTRNFQVWDRVAKVLLEPQNLTGELT